MRPYENKLHWNLKGRSRHLIDGLTPVANQLSGPVREAFLQRAAMMHRALRALVVVSTLLYLGIVVTGATWVARLIPSLAEAVDALQTIAQTLSGVSAGLLLMFLLIRRRIGQIEADLIALCLTKE